MASRIESLSDTDVLPVRRLLGRGYRDREITVEDAKTGLGGDGSGDVVGPASAVSGNFAGFTGTSGKTLQDTGKVPPSGAVVGTSDAQTLTNKTINGASNTLTVRLANDVTGVLPTDNGGAGTANSDYVAPPAVNTQTGSSYTLALTDAFDIVEMNNAGANTVTIPTNANVAFAIGTVITISQIGVGTSTVLGDTGVTLNGVSAGSCDLTNQWSGVSLYKRAANTWVVQGAHDGVS